ncbi:hypothetical protein I7X29_13690 [Capnocytophaga sp. p1a2]|uniref:hypothetical protein n=1 Tax=uncultured Capnocytophaga sp. TaxID=159273 RepID=UPI0018E17F65|nr:hypothetical protein [uncultured Capnocytophaga sp.]MBI1669631.1 hypothetical protein [Capnocytophaga periodontitidis]
MSLIRKKDPKNQFIFAKKLLKIARIILIVSVIFNLSYVLLKKPFLVFGGNFTGEVIGLFSPLVFFVLLYVFAYLWVLDRHIAYNQYAKDELPPIRVKAVNDRIIQVLLLISSCTFFVWILWSVVQKIIEQQNGENSSFVEYIEIAVLVAIIVAFIYDFIRNYRGTFYALEIRNESLYIFYKEALTHTIPLNSIHHIHFFAKKQGKSTRIHPRMQVYTSKIERILHIKLSIDNYHLLKTFFSRKRIKIIDEYSSRSKK